jgi:hypothetical protein
MYINGFEVGATLPSNESLTPTEERGTFFTVSKHSTSGDSLSYELTYMEEEFGSTLSVY